MAERIDYYAVSAVVFSETPRRHISKVFVHKVDAAAGELETPGELISRESALVKMKTFKFYTIWWKYTKPAGWQKGALIQTENVGGVHYLRTHADNTTVDNLDNLIEYKAFGQI